MAELNCFLVVEWLGCCSVCDWIENAAVAHWMLFSCEVYFAVPVYVDQLILVQLGVAVRLLVASEASHLVAETTGCGTVNILITLLIPNTQIQIKNHI